MRALKIAICFVFIHSVNFEIQLVDAFASAGNASIKKPVCLRLPCLCPSCEMLLIDCFLCLQWSCSLRLHLLCFTVEEIGGLGNWSTYQFPRSEFSGSELSNNQIAVKTFFFIFWSPLELGIKIRAKRRKPWIFPKFGAKFSPNSCRIPNAFGHGCERVPLCNISQFKCWVYLLGHAELCPLFSHGTSQVVLFFSMEVES